MTATGDVASLRSDENILELVMTLQYIDYIKKLKKLPPPPFFFCGGRGLYWVFAPAKELFLVMASRAYSPVAALRFLIAVTSLVSKHRL